MIPGIVSVLTKLKAFLDNFNRADNASTLVGASGASKKWIAHRGTWGISGNKANTATAAASYPMAGIKTGARTARVKITNGTAFSCGYGVAFWITDAYNWYGLHSDRTHFVSSAQVLMCLPPFTNYNCGGVCSQFQPWGGSAGHFCASCGCGGCFTQFGGPVGCGCQGTGPGCINLPGFTLVSSNFNGNGQDECGICGATQAFQLVTVYQQNYLYFARLIQMASGSVSTLNSRLLAHTTATNNITFLQVETNTTSNNSVRTSASMDGGAASTAVVAIASPVQTGIHGILIAPRDVASDPAQQSTNVDDFDYAAL